VPVEPNPSPRRGYNEKTQMEHAHKRRRGHALARAARAAFVTAAGLILASCVVSDKPLLAEGEQIAGAHFTAQLFRAFSNGASHERRTAIFRWQDGAYAKAPDGETSVVELVAQKLGADDYIVQGAYPGKKVFQYWIARRVNEGAYLLFALDETSVPRATRDRLCVENRSSDICRIETRDQLLKLAHATADRGPKEAEIAIVVEERSNDSFSEAPLH
jgi:hypothetical protein